VILALILVLWLAGVIRISTRSSLDSSSLRLSRYSKRSAPAFALKLNSSDAGCFGAAPSWWDSIEHNFVWTPMGWRYRFGRCTLCGGIVCAALCRVSGERGAKKDRKTYE
jgi:hypothetical protein